MGVAMDQRFFWSDNWWIENEKAWFVSGEVQSIFCVDLKTEQCEHIADLPETVIGKWRPNPRCMRSGNTIWCFPDLGNEILIVDLNRKEFRIIEINNPKKKRMSIVDFWIVENHLYAVSGGLSAIIEINLKKEKIEATYRIALDETEAIGRATLANGSIYVVLSGRKQIYEFSIDVKKFSVFKLPNIDAKLYSISFDREKFWLSGNKREIYVWKRETNELITLTGFPLSFGRYNFAKDQRQLLDCEMQVYKEQAFSEIRCVGDYVWFIPYLTNQILYVNKNTYEINVFEIKGENESLLDLDERILFHKYLWNYVHQERYLGLFSLKNEHYFEIDTESLKKRDLNIHADEVTIDKIRKRFFEKYGNLNEHLKIHRKIYAQMLGKKNNIKEKKMSVGEKIFSLLNH